MLNRRIMLRGYIMAKRNKIARLFLPGLIMVMVLTAATFRLHAAVGNARPVLSKLYPKETLRDILIPGRDWHPFSTAAERDAWLSLPEATRRGHIERGEEAMKSEWPLLPASLFLEFARVGDRGNYERPYSARRTILSDLVIAECMEGNGRFMDAIANAIWGICEESTWCVPAHLTVFHGHYPGPGLPETSDPVIDLFAGETASLLSWSVYLLRDKLEGVSPILVPRIQRELDDRILTPYLTQNFWWMDKSIRIPNNWNPWCASNCLTAALLMEKDESRRLDMVNKAVEIIDQFIEFYPDDGGCNEGPSYWGRSGGSLFDCLELLHRASNGRIDVFGNPLIQEIGRYLYRARINDDFYINIGDCGHRVSIDRDMVFRYGKRIGDDRLIALAAHGAAELYKKDPCVSGSMGRRLEALFRLSEMLSLNPPPPPLLRDVWFPHEDMQVMAARAQEGSAEGLFVSAYASHNGTNHNHNDVGSFIVYADGHPMIVDVGVGTYTAKTFGAGRYDIWTMQSAYHSLPTVNGIMQQNGAIFASRNVAYKMDNTFAELTMDIAGAYPPEAGIVSWARTVRLNRGKDIRVTDSFRLNIPSRDIMLSLMTPCETTLEKPGIITLQPMSAKNNDKTIPVYLYYDPKKLTPEFEKIFDEIEDARMQRAWGDNLTRILLKANSSKHSDIYELRIAQK